MKFALLFLLILAAASAAEPVDFNRDVQPILSENCYQCHGPDGGARKADLRLDKKEGAYRTKDGITPVKPGDSANSDAIVRVLSTDRDEVMPPPKSHRKLTDAQKQLLKRWVDEGAKWGEHWAFIAPKRGEAPGISDFRFQISDLEKRDAARGAELRKQQARLEKWARNPIDAFVLDRMLRGGLAPSAEAAPAKLCRRLYLDLTGLPPTPEEVEAFVHESHESHATHENLVDRLLASPRYGERMVWEWLDAARYADTNGYQGDPTRAMWYWRDWAIQAFNENKPFDQFTIEQLAGDLLPEPTRGQLIATGFHRNHMINGEGGRIAEESRVDYVQDRVETTGMVWMALTFNCCRCHDHKFDPMAQREYYQLSAYFNSIDETGGGGNDGQGLANPTLALGTPEDRAKIDALKAAEAQAKKERDELEAKTAEARSQPEIDAAKKKHEDAKKAREKAEAAVPRTMVMRERAKPRDTFILVKGAYDKFADKVEHGTPAALPPLAADAPKNRLALARWLVSPEHPLTARVTVNRLWQQFFGRGLVKTAEDFGVQGEKPTHPELLDWLAVEFRESGWDVKHLVKLIVTSATYAQSSGGISDFGFLISDLGESSAGTGAPQIENQKSEIRNSFAHDPENKLLARGARYRLPSWMLRDQALAVSGLLVEKVGGPPVKVYQPANIWEDATFGQIQFTQDHGEALYRRSLYIFWRRIVAPTLFFDTANRQNCAVKTGRTNTPLHALVTLNDITYVEAARALAERMMKHGANDEARLDFAFRLCTARPPSAAEKQVLASSLARLRERYTADPEAAKKLIATGESKPDPALPAPELAAFTALGSLLLNLDETLTRE